MEPTPRSERSSSRKLLRYAPFVGIVRRRRPHLAAVRPLRRQQLHPPRPRAGRRTARSCSPRANKDSVKWGPKCDTTRGHGRGPAHVRAAVRRSRSRATTAARPRRASPPTRSPSRSTRRSRTSSSRRSSSRAARTSRCRPSSRPCSSTSTFFEAHYETYGRHVKIVPVKASGAPDDEDAARSDAIKVATEIKAFASWGGPSQTSVYADELSARGVLCVGDCLLAATDSYVQGEQEPRLAHVPVDRAARRALEPVPHPRARRAAGRVRGRAPTLKHQAAGLRRRALRRELRRARPGRRRAS